MRLGTNWKDMEGWTHVFECSIKGIGNLTWNPQSLKNINSHWTLNTLSCAGHVNGMYGPCEVVSRKCCTPLCCVDWFCFRQLRYSSCLSFLAVSDTKEINQKVRVFCEQCQQILTHHECCGNLVFTERAPPACHKQFVFFFAKTILSFTKFKATETVPQSDIVGEKKNPAVLIIQGLEAKKPTACLRTGAARPRYA